MTGKMMQVGSRNEIVELPEGCKKAKVTNNGPGVVFVGFGDQGYSATSQDNRLDVATGELQLEVPEGATHMAILGTSQGTVMVDVGEEHAKSKASAKEDSTKKK